MKKWTRRQWIASAASLPGIFLLGSTRLLANKFVDPNDATAKALKYVTDVSKIDPKATPLFKKGSNCANCQFYVKVDDKKGSCTVLRNEWVPANAWCISWVVMPAKK